MSSRKPSDPRPGHEGRTPINGNGTLQDPYTLTREKAASASNLIGKKTKRRSLDPVSPSHRKRPRSTSDLTAEDSTAASGDRGDALLRSKKSVSCKEKGRLFFKYEGPRAKHAQDCLDPDCRHQLPLAPKAPLDGKRFTVQDQQSRSAFSTETPDHDEASNTSEECGGRPDDAGRGSPLAKDIDPRCTNETNAPHVHPNNLHNRNPSQSQDESTSNMHSPSNQQRPTSNATPSTSQTTRPAISQMHRDLRNKLLAPITQGDKKGRVYVITCPEYPYLCKIGKAKDSDTRASQIKRACGTNPKIFDSVDVIKYTRTEVLVHAYLADLRKKTLTCKKCKEGHCEWFDIAPETAMVAIRKWAKFMNEQNPYHSDATRLKPFWKLWLDSHHNVNAVDLDADGFRARWDTSLSPSWFTYFRVWFDRVQDLVWSFFWPIFATLGWTMVFVVVQHPAAFFFMASSVVGAFFSMSHDKQLVRSMTAKLD